MLRCSRSRLSCRAVVRPGRAHVLPCAPLTGPVQNTCRLLLSFCCPKNRWCCLTFCCSRPWFFSWLFPRSQQLCSNSPALQILQQLEVMLGASNAAPPRLPLRHLPRLCSGSECTSTPGCSCYARLSLLFSVGFIHFASLASPPCRVSSELSPVSRRGLSSIAWHPFTLSYLCDLLSPFQGS